MRVHMGRPMGAPVGEEDIHLRQHGGVVLAVVLEGELAGFMRVGVIEPQRTVARSGGHRGGGLGGEQEQRGTGNDGAQAPFQPVDPDLPQLTPNGRYHCAVRGKV